MHETIVKYIIKEKNIRKNCGPLWGPQVAHSGPKIFFSQLINY